MEKKHYSGFEEIEHTADVSLRVWAPTYPQLFIEAMRGMYAIMDLSLAGAPCAHRTLHLKAEDYEELLVNFLAEILFTLEMERIAYDEMDIILQEQQLTAQLEGRVVISQRKEIKAVTYHNLEIKERSEEVEVTLVFDV